MSRQVELHIVGLTGPESADQAAQALRDNQGVAHVVVDSATGRARVTPERGAVVEHLMESLEQVGFMARLATEDDD